MDLLWCSEPFIHNQAECCNPKWRWSSHVCVWTCARLPLTFIFQLSGRPIKQSVIFYVCGCVCVKAWHGVSTTLGEMFIVMWVSGASWAELQAVWRSGWLFDCLMTMWALHLAAFRLRLWRTADIKCLMLACSTDVQIKSSPERLFSLFFLFPAFWQYICCFCCFSQIRFKFYLSPPL